MSVLLMDVRVLVDLAEEKPTTAFILSLIAGVLFLIGGSMVIFFFAVMGETFGHWMGMMGFPWGGLGLAHGITGLVIGALVIIASVMLDSRPAEHKTLGGGHTGVIPHQRVRRHGWLRN